MTGPSSLAMERPTSADRLLGAEFGQLRTGLQRQDHADKERHQRRDRQGADADIIDLLENRPDIPRRIFTVIDRLDQQGEHFSGHLGRAQQFPSNNR